MKIVSILLLIILLAMLTPLVGCNNQPDSLTFTSEGEPTVEAQILGIKLALQDLNTRLTELEEKVFGGLYDNPWSQQSFEARLKALEEKLGVDPPGMENPWAKP